MGDVSVSVFLVRHDYVPVCVSGFVGPSLSGYMAVPEFYTTTSPAFRYPSKISTTLLPELSISFYP